MNSMLCSPRVFDVLSQCSCHCYQRILRKNLSKFLLDQRQSNLVTFTSQAKTLRSDRSKSSILHPKPWACVEIKTMEQFSSNSQAEKDDLLTPAETNSTPTMNVGETDGWLNIGLYSVFAWSVSGVESCVVVKSEDVQVAFDMGIAVKESVKVPNVFITHGHIDHVGAVNNHIAKRSLFGMKPARYFVPPHLIDPIKSVVQAHHVMSESGPSGQEVNILPFTEGETVRLNSRYFVKTFPTIHRVPSQGYILYKEERRLKEEYRGMEGFEVSALHRAGKDIHDIVITPEIAYTGDTVVDVFINPPTPDLLKVKLLITEATFLDENDKRGNSCIELARARGHIHLAELAQNAELFNKVGHMVLVHFSNKYSPKYICDCVRDRLPSQLRSKVTPATVAAATKPTTYLL